MKKIIISSLLLFGGFTLFAAPVSAHSIISNSGRDNGFDSIHTKLYSYGYDPIQAGDMKAVLLPHSGIFSKIKSKNIPIIPTDLRHFLEGNVERKSGSVVLLGGNNPNDIRTYLMVLVVFAGLKVSG